MRRISLLIFCIVRVYAYHTHHYECISQQLQKYSRAATVLEIANGKNYSIDMAYTFPKHIFILLTVGPVHNIHDTTRLPKNLIILNPKFLPNAAIDILGRCEHFDLVIVQDFSNSIHSSVDAWYNERLKSFFHLGDFLCIELDKRNAFLDESQPLYVSQEASNLYLFHTPKDGLDIARWNQHKRPRSETHPYKIESSFENKFFIKREQKSTWLPGINLITFVMLGGIYPSNDTIVEWLRRYKKLRHNDLVVGNFIIQGTALRPIDFNDAERKVPSKKSLKAMIKLFKQKLRYSDPQASLNLYQQWLNKYL